MDSSVQDEGVLDKELSVTQNKIENQRKSEKQIIAF
jgi:hypothetical protein